MTSPSLSPASSSLTARSSGRMLDFHREEYPQFIIKLNFNTTLQGLAKHLTNYLGILDKIIGRHLNELDIEEIEDFYDELKEWVRTPQIFGNSLADTCKYWIDKVIALKGECDDMRAAEELPEICCHVVESSFVIEHSSDTCLDSVKTTLKSYFLIVDQVMRFWSHPGRTIRRLHGSLGLWLENNHRKDQPPIDALKFWAKRVDRIKKEHKGAAAKNLPFIVLQEMIPLYSLRI